MRKTYFLAAAALLLIGLSALWITRHYLRQRPVVAGVDDVEKWRSLSEKTAAWLTEHKFTEIKNVESEALTSVPSQRAVTFFAAFAINCAKSRRLAAYGDPYVFLIKAEEALGNDIHDPNLSTLLYDLAYEHSLINCYHRAYKLLEFIPEDRRSPEANTLHNRLKILFSKLRTTTAELEKTRAATTGDKALFEQLRDLLGIIPQNIFYSEQSLSDDKEYPREADIIDKHQRLALTQPPIGISTFKPLKRLPPWPKAITDDEPEEEQPADEETEEDEDDNYSKSQVESVDLSDSERQMAYRLLSETRSTGSLDRSSPVFTAPIRSVLSKTSIENMQSFTINDLQQSFPKGPYLTLVFNNGSETAVYFLVGSSVDSLRVLKWQSSYEEFQLTDVTGDGAVDLIVRYRGGTGGFLDVTIINPLGSKAVFHVSSLPRGEIRMIDLDNDAALELLALEKTELQRKWCNQCPARYLVTVFDYDHRSYQYKAINRRLSYGEFNSLASEDMFGLTDIELAAGMRLAEAKASIRETLQKLKRQETRNWSPQVLAELSGLFDALDTAEDSATALSQDKLDLQTALVETLNRPDLPPNWLALRRFGQLWRVRTLIHMGQPERVFELTSEPWLLDGTAKPDFRAELFNVNGISNQLLGRMSQAYDSYSNALKELEQSPPETAAGVEGNLAFYFTTVGDTEAAYRYAQKALDHAILADGSDTSAVDASDTTTVVAEETSPDSVTEISQSQALDMLQLAVIARRTGQERQALDWIGRALRFGRRDANSTITTTTLRIAADIALANNWSDLALQLLDEAVLGTSDITWKNEGGAVFLLYAKAISAKHDQRQAIELLKVSAKLSKGIDPTVHCIALYSISRIMKDLNDSAEALKYARLAFDGLTAGRRSVSVEDQKFSFLADKKVIASWLFQLLIETNQDPVQLLDAVESWKMRTFLDLHFDKMAGLAAPLNAEELNSRLSAILNDGDLLLDYVELDSSAIVLAVTKTRGIQVATIKTNPNGIAALRAKALKAFDIRDAASLAAIRNDSVDGELMDALRKLYVETLGPIQIPNDVRRLIIAPDEFLFGIPWPALKPSATEYLADRYEIVLIPSAVVAIGVNNAGREQTRSQRTLIACALGGVTPTELNEETDESITKTDYAPLARLSGGWRECEKVANALKDTEIELLADTQTLKQQGRFAETSIATPERFLTKAPGARIIHMVGHGIYNLKQPMQSRLFLENGPAGRTVRATDFSSLDLKSVELVTLAACETGQYGGMVGAEPLGFLRALLGAGAKTVLLTNWEADDDTTADLLSDFYSRLHYTRTSTALREAQQAIKHRFKHPYFWAAHSIYGNWN